MTKKSLGIIFLGVTVCLFSPLLVRAQALQAEDIINNILRQYDQIHQNHSDSVDSARDIVNSSEEELLQSLFEQIDGASQVVQDTQSGGIAISINPPHPEPHQEITASLAGYGVVVNEAHISWFVDGDLVSSGTGVTSIKTKLGAAGSQKVISVRIEPTNMAAFTRSMVIVPNTVDLLWEAVDSYTPPFYRGKALPSYDSIVKVTAISDIFDASGSKVNSNELVYSWSLNGRNRDLSEYSGYGSTTAYAFASFLNKGHLVSVAITNISRGIDARKTTLFSLHDPEIIFYKKEPLGGINYEVAVTSRTSIDQNGAVRLVAEPYSFDMRNGFSDLSLNWRINNNPLQNTEGVNRGEIPIITQNPGLSKLSLEISTDKILQKAQKDLDILVE